MKFPDIKNFTSSENLAEHLLSKVDLSQVKVVSFDVFDTLLFRKLHPDLILDCVGRKLSSLLLEQNHQVTNDPSLTRSKAYGAIAEQKIAAGLDPDMILEELVPEWIKITAGTPDAPEGICAQILSFEYECERLSVYPNQILMDAAKALTGRGVDVVFTSDMYLGSRYITRLLKNVGGHFFTASYVSGDHSLLKRTGRLYHKLLESEKVAPHQVIHVGDNPFTDGIQASRQGIHACLLRCPKEKSRTAALHRDFKRFLADRGWVGHVASSFVTRHYDVSRSSGEEIFGLKMLGPVFSTFAHRLAERCREENITRVYFAAREGFILKRVFESISPIVWPDNNGPELVYLCVSRLTTFLASAQSYGSREASHCLANTHNSSVRAMLAPYHIDPVLLTARAAKYDVDDIDAPLIYSDGDPENLIDRTPLGKIISDPFIQKLLNQKHQAAYKNLRSYLYSTGFFKAGQAAFVDVGWTAQIQDNIFHAYKDRADFPLLFGFYLGIRSAAKKTETPHNRIEGLLTDQSVPDWHGSAVFLFVQALEAITRAPHGTVIGYQWDLEGGRHLPVFKSDNESTRQHERKDDELIVRIQSGILAYAEEYTNVASILSLSSEHYLKYSSSLLDRVLRFPNKQEAKWLLGLSNVADLGSSKVYRMGGESCGNNVVKNIVYLPRILRKSFWPNGTLAQSRIPILPSLLVVLQGIRLAPQKASISPTPREKGASCPTINLSADEPLQLAWETALDGELDDVWRQILSACKGGSVVSRKELLSPPVKIFDVLRSNALALMVNLLRFIKGIPQFSLSGLSLTTFLRGYVKLRLK